MQSHLFWGANAPLSSLTGAGLLIMASGRIDSALICALSLAWIGALTMFAAGTGRKVFPARGETAALAFTASFTGLLFFFALWLVSPFAAMESAFFITLCPVFFLGSNLYGRVRAYDTAEMVVQAVSEAFVMGVLVLAAALIREPLGSGSLSVPGWGVFRFSRTDPLAVLSASSGILMLLGYALALYRRFRNRYIREDD
jgi:hypothetical protein